MSTTAVLLIAHGSRHAPANDDLRRLAADLAAVGDYSVVEPAFLELAGPDIPSGGSRCVERGAGRILMIPYFLSAGVHLLRDLTAARDALQARFPAVDFLLGPPLGPHPILLRLVSDRARALDHDGPPPDFASAAVMAERYTPMGGHESEPGSPLT